MKVEKKNYEDLYTYLFDKYKMYCTADERGVDIAYHYCDMFVTTFVPWGYEVTINDDGYPEVRKGDDQDEEV